MAFPIVHCVQLCTNLPFLKALLSSILRMQKYLLDGHVGPKLGSTCTLFLWTTIFKLKPLVPMKFLKTTFIILYFNCIFRKILTKLKLANIFLQAGRLYSVAQRTKSFRWTWVRALPEPGGVVAGANQLWLGYNPPSLTWSSGFHPAGWLLPHYFVNFL